MRHRLMPFALAALMTCAVQSAGAEEPTTPKSDTKTEDGKTPGPAPKIQWFGTWTAAKAEAARTGRPILLTSAAPQCKGTPGIW